MKKLLIIGLLVLLSGCTSYKMRPHVISGHYYMVGDSDCRYWKTNPYKKIACYDKSKEFTDSRSAMTNQQLDMYRHNEQMRVYAEQKADRDWQQGLDSLNGATSEAKRTTCVKGAGIINCF